MAKTTKKSGTAVRRQGRRVVPALRKTTRSAKNVATRVQLTLGELIAATIDTVGAETDKVATLLESRQFQRAIGRKIVFV